MPTRRELTNTNRRESILRVFAARVARDGYSDTSIADIASDLGVSKGTIVHHFGTKLRLLESVQVTYMQRRLAEAHHVISVLSSPSGQLAGIIYALLKCHRDDRDATLTFTRELVRYAGEDQLGVVRTQRAIYTSLVRQIIDRGVESGEFHTDDPHIVTLQLFGMCNWAWAWYSPTGEASLEQIAGTYLGVVLGGLQTERVEDLDALLKEAIAAVQAAPLSVEEELVV
ncbi:MAG: TetR family transcriptional regulator [Thermoleophilia bacterium]|nr:TetR family transcriptional regulator [Thermoleophilia bacterium]